jgi:ketosteroid isomerase-like protein
MLGVTACGQEKMQRTEKPGLDRQWQNAFNAGDGNRLVALYAEDAIVMPPGQEMVRGLRAVRPVMTAHVSEGLRATITPVETQVHGDNAWQVGTYRLEGPTGSPIDHGKFVQLWHREPAGWRIARDIWNSSVASH